MIYAIVVVAVLILDQGFKYWTTLNIPLDTGEKTLIPKILSMTNIHNDGAAFGILTGMRWLLVAIVIVFAIAVIFVVSRKIIQGSVGRWLAVLVLAGAIGNGLDRALYGYVVDMFRFDFFPRFPVFNIADIFISVCGVLFCLYIIFHKDYEPEETFNQTRRASPQVRDQNSKQPPSRPARPAPRPDQEDNPFANLAFTSPSEDDAGFSSSRGSQSAAFSPYDPPSRTHSSPSGAAPRQSAGQPSHRPRPAAQQSARTDYASPAAAPHQPSGQPTHRPRPATQAQPTRTTDYASPAAAAPHQPSGQPSRRPKPATQAQSARSADSASPAASASRRPNYAAQTKPAPKKTFNVDSDIPEFSLEDILSEFSDNR